MAVDAVSGVGPTTTTPDSGGGDNSRIFISEDTLKKMTAKEIMDGYNTQNWAVPDKILAWAQQELQTNPDSKITYGESGAGGDGGVGGESNDAVDYQATLDEQGMSLKEQCKEFTRLSAEKETRDLDNITKIAPYAKDIPQDETDGNNGESEVSKVLKEIHKDMVRAFQVSFGVVGKDFKEGQKFFKAFQKGTNDELIEIDDSLEAMQDALSGALSDAKDSKQYGEKTIELGKELKSHTKFWQVFGSRRKAAKQAIEQGDKTVKMAERTDKLATAIAKDNDVALDSLQQNIKAVDETKPDEGGGEGGGDTSGTPPVVPAGGGGTQ